MIKQFGFTEEEYTRVRGWLLSALEIAPGPFDEAELLVKLRAEVWHLVTADHAASVVELVRIDGELIGNVLLIGGEKGKALREIIPAQKQFCEFLRHEGFTKLVGTPRKEFHNILKAQGFEQEHKELVKRLQL
ncbi:hypothetical protein [Sinorhizobium medicae]|uniref:hypothetical protein n=1 Tax=Sinorhizobium medicae TaxID=110321 RepID=UPI001F2AAD83|nr:hypothetical protein [Sinorhizobium medicae]